MNTGHNTVDPDGVTEKMVNRNEKNLLLKLACKHTQPHSGTRSYGLQLV